MSIPDTLLSKYVHLVTDLSLEEKQAMDRDLENGVLHPRDAKIFLGRTIVRMYHGEEAAKEATDYFQNVFQKGAIPEDMPETVWNGETSILLIDFLVQLGMMSSKSEARRMIQSGGVRINGAKVQDLQHHITFEKDVIIGVGKRKFHKVTRGG